MSTPHTFARRTIGIKGNRAPPVIQSTDQREVDPLRKRGTKEGLGEGLDKGLEEGLDMPSIEAQLAL